MWVPSSRCAATARRCSKWSSKGPKSASRPRSRKEGNAAPSHGAGRGEWCAELEFDRRALLPVCLERFLRVEPTYIDEFVAPTVDANAAGPVLTAVLAAHGFLLCHGRTSHRVVRCRRVFPLPRAR